MARLDTSIEENNLGDEKEIYIEQTNDDEHLIDNSIQQDRTIEFDANDDPRLENALHKHKKNK